MLKANLPEFSKVSSGGGAAPSSAAEAKPRNEKVRNIIIQYMQY
jgi:hypothetical protein